MAKLNIGEKIVEVEDEVIKWLETRDHQVIEKLSQVVHGVLHTFFPHENQQAQRNEDGTYTNHPEPQKLADAHAAVMAKMVNPATGTLDAESPPVES